MHKQVALIVLDGWGDRDSIEDNAIKKAKTPFFDYLIQNYSNTPLEASGQHVGLPEGQMGNSEIGHTTIGAGRVIDTDLVRINKAIESGEYDNNSTFSQLFEHANKYNSDIHLVSLIGCGGVHAHEDHLFAFLKLCKKKNFSRVLLHLITDGRDAAPYDSLDSIIRIHNYISDNQIGKIATISGRYFAMDRDNNWDRLERFTDLFWTSTSKKEKTDLGLDREQIIEKIESFHQQNKTDEHVEPFKVSPNYVNQNDAILFLNYRSDRARMLSSKILEKRKDLNLFFVTMTQYGTDFNIPFAFPNLDIKTTLAREISLAGLTQVHIAETEKFPHATYFLNGGKESPHPKEEHVLLQSNKDIKTHDQKPEMQARKIADEAIKKIKAGVNLIFINFANPDMVGHTANVPAIIEALEFVDAQLKRVVDTIIEWNGVALITADHGNAEINFDRINNEAHTAHTTNKVPCILTDRALRIIPGSLSDIAPTVLDLLGLEKPKEMTGNSLIQK